MKTCTKCNKSKNKSDFGSRNNLIISVCKECRNKEAKEYRRKKGLERGVIVTAPKRKDKLALSKICTTCDKEKNIELFPLDRTSSDNRHSSCLECRKAKEKRYRKNNKEVCRQVEKNRYLRDREKRLEQGRIFRSKPENKEKIRARLREKYKTDPEFRTRSRMYVNLWVTLKINNERTIGINGYSCKQLKSHIEGMFSKGMDWSNYGAWEIDHVKPVSLLVKEGVTDPAIINALSNLQPLWAEDNRAKANKY